LLLKPQTFMNLSGNAVTKAASFYKIPPERVLVLYDDISLAPGRLRIRLKGSAGGHNGIKSIIAGIGEEFPRIKIGVGERRSGEAELADFVLSKFSKADAEAVTSRFDDIRSAIELIMSGEVAAAMSRYNS
ncbi:MAG: aminoacyl-tRNA hydrolase, partial [Pygmaiobacter sp.]